MRNTCLDRYRSEIPFQSCQHWSTSDRTILCTKRMSLSAHSVANKDRKLFVSVLHHFILQLRQDEALQQSKSASAKSNKGTSYSP